MIQSASEIKQQILQQENEAAKQSIPETQRNQFIELGTAVKRMAGTKGWKIVEAWLLRKLDVGEILTAKPEQLPFVQAKAQAFAEVIKQVNYWITLAEQLDNKKE
jgi:hypothetical protein